MIKVHRLNGQEIILNAELIECIDSVPDTVITLYTNNRFVVKESMEEIYRLILLYKQTVNTPAIDHLTRSNVLQERT